MKLKGSCLCVGISTAGSWAVRVSDGNIEDVSLFWDFKCVVNSEFMHTGKINSAGRSYESLGKLKAARLRRVRCHTEQHFLAHGNVRPQTSARTTAGI